MGLVERVKAICVRNLTESPHPIVRLTKILDSIRPRGVSSRLYGLLRGQVVHGAAERFSDALYRAEAGVFQRLIEEIPYNLPAEASTVADLFVCEIVCLLESLHSVLVEFLFVHLSDSPYVRQFIPTLSSCQTK